ncbi:MAG: PAAR domain-containing protein [Stenotrophomonas sp.]|uniref:PAAR domain-containing protein n=1 Tax=Stenotrophomonas sp. TaxID=69392 RepID=UPI003D6D0EEB
MARNWIVLGDATTGGGRVITASPYTDIDGIAVARVTDKATCPLHKGVFSILNGDQSIIIDGHPVALNGASLECGCKVLAMKQHHVFVDAGGGGSGSSRTTAVTEVAVAAVSIVTNLRRCDQAIRFIGETGHALANLRYTLHLADGATVEGTTDEEGKTRRFETDTPEAVVKAELHAPADQGSCCAGPIAGDVHDEEAEVFEVEEATTTEADLGVSFVSVKAPGHERSLTSGEIDIAKLVFGSAVDYAKVKVHNHGYWLLFGLQQENTAVTPNGEMYFPKGIHEDDFSKVDVELQAFFIHEMVHVWQYQLGYPVKRVRGPRPNMNYEYHLGGGKKLCDYNMEAQGDILADYFLVAHRAAQARARAFHYRLTARFADMLKTTISDFLLDPGSTSHLPKTTK